MSWSVNAVDCASTGYCRVDVAGEAAKKAPRRVDDRRQPTAQVDEESAVDVLVHEAAHHRVEQGDLVSAVAARAREKEINDPAQSHATPRFRRLGKRRIEVGKQYLRSLRHDRSP
jgi:hypothetical protein